MTDNTLLERLELERAGWVFADASAQGSSSRIGSIRTDAKAERFAAHPSAAFRTRAARSGAASPGLLTILASDVLPVRLAVAANPAAPPDTLRDLAGDRDCVIAVLNNSSTPVDILECAFLMRSHASLIVPDAAAAASRVDCPQHILRSAARRGTTDQRAALAVARNPPSDSAVLCVLLRVPNDPSHRLGQPVSLYLPANAVIAVLRHANCPVHLMAAVSQSDRRSTVLDTASAAQSAREHLHR